MSLTPRKKRLPFDLRLIALPLIALVLVVAAWSFWSSVSLRRSGRQALSDGDLPRAEQAFEAASRKWLGSRQGLEGLAAVRFAQNRIPDGIALLSRAGSSGNRSVLANPASAWRELIDCGEYAAVNAWFTYLGEGKSEDKPALLLYEAVALAGLHEEEQATEHLAAFEAEAGQVGLSPYDRELEGLRSYLRELRKGTHDCVFGRGGEPGHGYHIEDGSPVPGIWRISSLTGTEPQGPDAGFLSERDQNNRLILTISRKAQLAAESAFAGEAGGFVLLDAKTGEILAAVSRPGEGDRTQQGPDWTAFQRHYEPGSIVKLFTHAAALREGAEIDRLYPLDCQGNNFIVDGQILYDWIPHGTIEDTAHATAVSCNTAFGKMGLLIGQHTLQEELRRWKFGEDPPDSLAPMRGGRVWEERLGSDWDVARAAMGLGPVRTTALHAALLAAAVATDGKMPKPLLLLERRNILGHTFERFEPGLWDEVADEAITAPVREGMLEAVRRRDGTATKMAAARVSLAVKTGTAGKREDGYDAILMGYFPAELPEVAFGMIVEGGGLAGIKGAEIMNAFLDSWYQRGGGVEEVRLGRTQGTP